MNQNVRCLDGYIAGMRSIDLLNALFGVCQCHMLTITLCFLFAIAGGVCKGQASTPSDPLDERWARFPVEVIADDGRATRTNLRAVADSTDKASRLVRDAITDAIAVLSVDDLSRFWDCMIQRNFGLNVGSMKVDEYEQDPFSFDYRHDDLLEAQIAFVRKSVRGRIEYVRRAPPSTPEELALMDKQVNIVCQELTVINAVCGTEQAAKLGEFIRSLSRKLGGPQSVGSCFRPISQQDLDTLIQNLRKEVPSRTVAGNMDNPFMQKMMLSEALQKQADLCMKAFIHYPASMSQEDIAALESFQREARVAGNKVRDLQRKHYGEASATTQPATAASSQPG